MLAANVSGDDLQIIQEKWSKLVPSFGDSFLKEIAMCYPISIAKNSKIAFEFTVLPEMCNNAYQLHGGSAATILDSLLGWALGGDVGGEEQNYVTVDLGLVHLHPLSEGDNVVLKAENVVHNDSGVSVVKGQLIRARDGLVCVEAKQALMRIGSVPVSKPVGPKVAPVALKPVPKPVKKVDLDKPATNRQTVQTSQLWKDTYSPNLFTKYPTMWTLISAENGANLYEFRVAKEATNVLGLVHGGFLATAIDACTFATNQKETPGQRSSVALHVSYLAGARIGDVLQLRTKTIEQTDSLATIHAVISNKQNGVNIATGYHTVLESSQPDIVSTEQLKAHL
uniref:4HBT domain-containing protein n=1 Tax=Panagrellus redivivus TaxID=6233 RepID=A0A7E4V7M5_PANRE